MKWAKERSSSPEGDSAGLVTAGTAGLWVDAQVLPGTQADVTLCLPVCSSLEP